MPPQRPSPQCPACRATRSSPRGRARAQSLDAAAARPASDISPGCANRAQLQTAARPAGQAVETAAARTPRPASSGGDGAAAGAAQTLALRPECTTGTTPAQLGRVFASQSTGAGLLAHAKLWRGRFGSVLSKTGRSTLLRETLLVKHVEPLAATLHIYGTGIVRLGGNSLSLERAFLCHLVSEQRSVSVEHYNFGVFHDVIGEIKVGKHLEHLRPA